MIKYKFELENEIVFWKTSFRSESISLLRKFILPEVFVKLAEQLMSDKLFFLVRMSRDLRAADCSSSVYSFYIPYIPSYYREEFLVGNLKMLVRSL